MPVSLLSLVPLDSFAEALTQTWLLTHTDLFDIYWHFTSQIWHRKLPSDIPCFVPLWRAWLEAREALEQQCSKWTMSRNPNGSGNFASFMMSTDVMLIQTHNTSPRQPMHQINTNLLKAKISKISKSIKATQILVWISSRNSRSQRCVGYFSDPHLGWLLASGLGSLRSRGPHKWESQFGSWPSGAKTRAWPQNLRRWWMNCFHTRCARWIKLTSPRFNFWKCTKNIEQSNDKCEVKPCKEMRLCSGWLDVINLYQHLSTSINY